MVLPRVSTGEVYVFTKNVLFGNNWEAHSLTEGQSLYNS